MKYRYIKVLIDKGLPGNDDGFFSIAEFQVFDNANRNVAFQKPASAASSYQPPSYAVNGGLDINQIYATAANVGKYPMGKEWLKVDLLDEYMIKYFKLYTLLWAGFGCISDYRIMGSRDDVNYKLLATITGKHIGNYEDPKPREDYIPMPPSESILYLKDNAVYGMQ